MKRFPIDTLRFFNSVALSVSGTPNRKVVVIAEVLA